MQRQRVKVNELSQRLSEALGSRYTDGLPESDCLGLIASRDAQQRIAELEQDAIEVREQLDVRTEELEAVRNLNRELMAKLKPLETLTIRTTSCRQPRRVNGRRPAEMTRSRIDLLRGWPLPG